MTYQLELLTSASSNNINNSEGFSTIAFKVVDNKAIPYKPTQEDPNKATLEFSELAYALGLGVKIPEVFRKRISFDNPRNLITTDLVTTLIAETPYLKNFTLPINYIVDMDSEDFLNNDVYIAVYIYSPQAETNLLHLVKLLFEDDDRYCVKVNPSDINYFEEMKSGLLEHADKLKFSAMIHFDTFEIKY